MPINNSIIFYLDNIFLAYRVSLVNSKETELDTIDLDEIDRIESENNYLELADRFEIFMEMFSEKFDLNTLQVFLLIGPRAGFTDSRIIFTWLRTNKMFNSGSDYFVAKISKSINEFGGDELLNLLQQTENANQKSLVYSREPNIGKR
ncbi:hypothetical protein HC766_04695 [Candidatus Gracilibacteria bacterium]|nr:hypothetical protein [Candidatus Gracilibacteria bacterium]NJS41615.1 hypothetical protein [Candidatus Gracilibacteria bacterium]